MLNLTEVEDVELFIKIKCSLFPDLQKSIVKPEPVQFSKFGIAVDASMLAADVRI